MHEKSFFSALAIAFMAISLLPLLVGQSTQDYKIFQTNIEITIDGKLDEWDSVQEFPVNLHPDGTKIPGSADIDVKVKFTYDPDNFYVALKAVDDQFEFPNRAWRFGDGFYLTFVDPHKGNESEQFWTFGFSWENNNKNVVLVNRDGVYFPGIFAENIKLEISLDKQNKVTIYEIAIPWNIIPPLKPFIAPEWGINVIYVDRDQEEREILELYPDSNFDTEMTNKRKGAIFTFVNHSPQQPEFQSQLNGSHFYSDQEKVLTIAANSPSEASGWSVKYIMSSGQKNFSAAESVSLNKGLNLIRYSLPKENYASGLNDLSLGIVDKDGSLRYTETHTFFAIDRNEFDSLAKRIADFKQGKKYAEDQAFRNSFPNLEIRLQWIQDFAQNAPAYADIRDLREWQDEIDSLLQKVENGEPALFPPGSLGRLAHRSEIDGTLQPYSVFVPVNYDGKTPMPLFVTLHGSGVDERQFIYSVVGRLTGALMGPRIMVGNPDNENYGNRLVAAPGGQRTMVSMIVIAPKARGLSSWYLGDSGKDVLECIEHVKTLYNIDSKRIILDGFSMGGYGAWRLSLLNPSLFKGVIIRSGAITPPSPLSGENILDLMKPGINISVLVIHGDKDNAIPVTDARKAVEKLEELKINHTYIEVKRGGHGDYDRWKDISSWLTVLH
jgi:predicted esterase